ncbi:plasmid partitioning protein RepB [Pseudooceanicola sp. CBS1P-1]|uniref:Plasmid partitioning protein RepB n=1 Tax=Pseudooceanicola albus TaxID=2692189 RepID=A0A6L7G528_9RHOB|nr:MULTISPECIES: plasmid partitioning protein RepB [Pseudooceanicola]MBT9385100.1 plasmid partitioning protein RepB [Pseudooceanicola endophyticus]MXN18608.1 plasmid partitioning protein RepB [Pseudooceanicola albus]
MARKPRTAFPATPGSGAADTPEEAGRKPRRAPMFVKGAASLDTAQQSAAAETRMYRMLPVDLIDPSPIRDRIDISEDLETLKRSLAEEGQQIPILVRPKPGDRYEIVTGRRRLQATKEIGRDQIQAFVRRMSDEEAFIAQGVENNARLETSFIERARTILSALETGFTQVQVEKFLGVDQTMISRMKTIYTGLGESLVMAIGPARGIGRRKWERLQKLVAESGSPTEILATEVPALPDSVERFDALLEVMERRAPKAPRAAPARVKSGTDLGHGLTASRKGKALTLKGGRQTPEALLEFLEARLPALLEEFTEKSK